MCVLRVDDLGEERERVREGEEKTLQSFGNFTRETQERDGKVFLLTLYML